MKGGENPSEGRILKIAGHRPKETGARRVPGSVVGVAPQEIGIVKCIQELETQFELHPFGNVAGLLNTPNGTEEMRSINENAAAQNAGVGKPRTPGCRPYTIYDIQGQAFAAGRKVAT